jgi:D-sedoheptulose 7-phosphate isomerase
MGAEGGGSTARAYLEAARSAFQGLRTEELERAVEVCWDSLSSGGKLLICGNGGSAADSQHLAAELVVRFRAERPGLPAIALSADTAVITAMANDYGYERIFARQVEVLGRPEDVLLAISTSGRSPNVLAAAETASGKGIPVIGLTGGDPGPLKRSCAVVVRAPSPVTSHAQECMLVLGHALCHCLEARLEAHG